MLMVVMLMVGGGELSIFSPLNEDGSGDRGAVDTDDHRLSLTTQLLLQSSQQVKLTIYYD